MVISNLKDVICYGMNIINYFKDLRLKRIKDLRRELRRNLENKRRQISHADNVFVDRF